MGCGRRVSEDDESKRGVSERDERTNTYTETTRYFVRTSDALMVRSTFLPTKLLSFFCRFAHWVQ